MLIKSAMLCAALEDMPIGAKPLGMAGAYCGSVQTPENLFYNPASIWVNSGINVYAFTARLYGLKELRYNSFSSTFYFRNTTYGVGIQTFGNTKYKENVFCVGVAKNFFKSIYLGAAIRYGLVNIKGYGQKGTIMVDLGGVVMFSTKMNWGWAIRNAGFSKIGRLGEKIPQMIISGFMFSPVRDITLNIDIYKESRFPVDYRSGVEMKVIKYLTLRTGIGTEPYRFSAGFSIIINDFSIDYAFNTHPYLELSHFFTIGLSLN